MPVRTVTFDCYGTLIDWRTGLCSTVPLARGGNGVSSDEFFRSWVATQKDLIRAYRPYREILEMAMFLSLSRVGVVPTPEELERASSAMGRWPAFDDARRALAALKGVVRLGILSNVEDAVLAQSVEQLGTAIDFTVTAEQVKSYKPEPAHFTACLQRTGLPANEILHVGWLEYDVIPAAAAGMRTCWINRERHPKPSGAAPDYEVSSLDELPPIVKSLNG